MQYLKQLYSKHRSFWNREHLISLLQSFALFAIALFIQHEADIYVGHVKGVFVPDLILDHIPTINFDFFIIQGALIITLVIVGLLISRPKYLIFTLKALAVFIITRSFFISLTHLGISPRELPLDTDSLGFGLYNWLYNTTGDFFFSGHTGAPYLMALIFWPEIFWRRFFIMISIIFAVAVLLAHIHYSIDVFAAPFMTYGIFVITKALFKKDYELALQS